MEEGVEISEGKKGEKFPAKGREEGDEGKRGGSSMRLKTKPKE